jgi:hypothetical protein
MAGYHLEWWTDRLKPICDRFIETVQGHPSETFWRHIYSPKEIYGGDLITGWLADLFPYINDTVTAAPTVRNPILDIPREALTSECGLSLRRLPTGLSCAPFKLKIGLNHPPKEMELTAGFIGVKQDATTGELEPEIGWAVLEQDCYAQALARVVAAASTGPTTAGPQSKNQMRFPELISGGVPKECIRLMERFEHGGQLFAQTRHPWSVRPISDLTLRHVSIPESRISEPAVHFMDLQDGRAVAYLYGQNATQHWWVIIGKPDGQEFHHDSVRVIAKGFLQFLQRLTEADGSYYFDAPDFLPEVVL